MTNEAGMSFGINKKIATPSLFPFWGKSRAWELGIIENGNWKPENENWKIEKSAIANWKWETAGISL